MGILCPVRFSTGSSLPNLASKQVKKWNENIDDKLLIYSNFWMTLPGEEVNLFRKI